LHHLTFIKPLSKRIFDIISSLFGLVLFSPFFIIIAVFIVIDSKGGVFFIQQRVGKNNVDFNLLKFRTMKVDSEKQGQLTISNKDTRITKVGSFLRKHKLDEIPQLINVLIGKMSVVGPRPEVRKYVNLYSTEQLKVLSVKPGLTDLASLKYINENELLGKSNDPEKSYIEEIMPEKLSLNLDYIAKNNLIIDIKLIFKTIGKLF
jgi:lipopolysaccharide/colanic/teichoic acid biosynthesis glycosyltransferase